MRVVILGAGGHAGVIAEILRLAGEHEPIGLLDATPGPPGRRVHGLPVLGDDEELERLGDSADAAIVGVGSVGATAVRGRLRERIAAAGLPMVPAIHPAATVSPTAVIGAGTAVMAGAVVGTGTVVEENVIVNTGAVVDHDCVIGRDSHIATGALLAGGVVVHEGAHVGIGACIREGIRIGRGAVVGAGSVVLRDVPADTVVYGVPARPRSGPPAH